jgi:hypothetical protein
VKKLFISIILFFVISKSFGFHNIRHAVTVGPMLHLNFEQKSKPQVSFSVEAAYWMIPDGFWPRPLSIDIGIEMERFKTRIYSEIQTGALFAGISAGPVLELQSN